MRTLVLFLALAGCGAVPAAPARTPLPAAPPPPPLPDEAILCPADVKQCPDGRYVGRNPDKGCVFDSCSNNNP